MKIEVKIPEVGESVSEALLAQWLRKEGDRVQKDELLFVIETDKVTLEVASPGDGILRIQVGEGSTVPVGTTVAVIETGAEAAETEAKPADQAPEPAKTAADEGRKAEPGPAGRAEPKPPPSAPTAPAPPAPAEPVRAPATSPEAGAAEAKPIISPSVRSLAEREGVDLSQVTPTGPGGRITEGDVYLFVEQHGAPGSGKAAAARPAPAESRPERSPEAEKPPEAEEGRAAEGKVERKPMSPIRRRIAERLLESRRNTAMLTTFNEVDMGRIQDLRKRLGEDFSKKHGVRLGLMSFFAKASATALKEIPIVNAYIDGNDIVYQYFYNIGVAVGAERGLIVPVIRNVDRLGFAKIEQAILGFVEKISQNKLALEDLEGGTFTITNGGVYGSLLSTPILNPPQSAILGLHKIEDRPVVVGGQIVIRPMMYVALSYDHRIIDGRDAVTFLKRIKYLIENPEMMIMELQ